MQIKEREKRDENRARSFLCIRTRFIYIYLFNITGKSHGIDRLRKYYEKRELDVSVLKVSLQDWEQYYMIRAQSPSGNEQIYRT